MERQIGDRRPDEGEHIPDAEERRERETAPPSDQSTTEGGAPDPAGTGYEPDDVRPEDSTVHGRA